MANLQMLAQAGAFNKVRAVKALAQAQDLTATLDTVSAEVATTVSTLSATTATLSDVSDKVDQLRIDVDGLLP